MRRANKKDVLQKPLFGRERRDLIERLVKAENLSASKIWAREMVIAKKLFNKYPDVRFWSYFALTYKLNSLAWLIGEGNNEVNRQWNYFLLDKAPNNETIEGEVIIGQMEFELKSPKTLKEFMEWKKQ